MPSALQVLALILPALAPVTATAGVPDWLPLSWFFSWTPPEAPIPVPITAQCERIHVTWQRGTATGPDPVAPYYFQVYTSAFIFPFIIPAGSNPSTDLTIPLAPGTQYQICMFDSNGNTGGCQAIYTVYANSTSPPTCANWTMPAKTLSVKSESSLGALSMYGWVDSCTDIRLTPLGGKPPFKFTVAPALHPPINITSTDMSPINWTVALSWASPFFISLVDSTGLSWSNGPIHSGNGKTDCLALASSSHDHLIAVSTTVVAAISGVVLGVVVSFMATVVIARRRASALYRLKEEEPTPYSYSNGDDTRYNSFASQPSLRVGGRPFAFRFPTRSKSRSGSGTSNLSSTILPRDYYMESQHEGPTHGGHNHSANEVISQPSRQSGNASANGAIGPGRQEALNQVYVIHHDSGRAPVSVITAGGTEVVELPPGYSSDYLGAGGRSTGSRDTAVDPARGQQGKSTFGSADEVGRTI